MSNYYTGRGDKGKSYVGRKKIAKTNIAFTALGDLDELNAMLGVLKTQNIKTTEQAIIEEVQEHLFIIQAHVAVFMFEAQYKPPVFLEENIGRLEYLIDEYEKKLVPAKKFIIPGTDTQSAWFDLVRTIVRRAERSVIHFAQTQKIPHAIIAYLNRLSTLLYVIARYHGQTSKKKEKHPRYH